MKEILEREDLLNRFLLGEVTEPERAIVEDRLLRDEEFYEQLLAAEGDLMDAYVRGALAAPERARFEENVLSSARQFERVEFARGLATSATLLHERESATLRSAGARSVSSSRRGLLAAFFIPHPARRYALAAAAFVLIAFAVWLTVERMRPPVDPQQARTEDVASPKPEQRPPDAVPNERDDAANKQERGSTASPVSGTPTPAGVGTPEPAGAGEGLVQNKRPLFATITLARGAVRDGTATATLVLPLNATHVRLRLEIDEDHYQSYRATISTPEGHRVWGGAARKDRAKDAQSVVLTLPVTSLRRGDYIVELSGAVPGGKSEPVTQYSFRFTPQH